MRAASLRAMRGISVTLGLLPPSWKVRRRPIRSHKKSRPDEGMIATGERAYIPLLAKLQGRDR